MTLLQAAEGLIARLEGNHGWHYCREELAALKAAVAEERANDKSDGCRDCGAPYGKNGWCDVVVPDEIWNSLGPDCEGGSGILCFCCMTNRIETKGLKDVPVIVVSGPYVDANERWRLIGWEHGHKVGLEEARSAARRVAGEGGGDDAIGAA